MCTNAFPETMVQPSAGVMHAGQSPSGSDLNLRRVKNGLSQMKVLVTPCRLERLFGLAEAALRRVLTLPLPPLSCLCSLFLQVSLVGFLFLLGLYVSSLASCMGSLYSAPRILQCIAQERVIPALAFLGHRVGGWRGSLYPGGLKGFIVYQGDHS